MNLTDQDLERIAREVDQLSIEIGGWMKQQSAADISTELKTFNNLVTYVDKESERRFVEGLHSILPAAGFVAEEGTGEPVPGGLNWIIDPLDGTTNFVHGLNIWCTSIGLARGSEPLVGVIYDPNANELFSGSRNRGARLNEKNIRVSQVNTLSKSLLATGFPYDDFGREEQYFLLLRALTHRTRGIRRLGSAALDMAWVACGRMEAFYEYGLNSWDVAAGTLLIREAGGMSTTFNGGDDPIFGEDLICSNGDVYEELLEVIRTIFPL
ncbi:MAG: inositol monophosphatase family protein [Flavobacteriales bacterium]|jgi:myo-inositol-1(or 4)-monophosphatase